MPGRRSAHVNARKQRFLDSFRQHGNVSQASKDADVDRRTPYKWGEDDPEFRADWDVAEQESIDRLEGVALDLATGKIKRPVVSAGKLVCNEAIYSERMIELILKARRPDLYKDRKQVEHSGEIRTVQGLLSDVPVPENDA